MPRLHPKQQASFDLQRPSRLPGICTNSYVRDAFEIVEVSYSVVCYRT